MLRPLILFFILLFSSPLLAADPSKKIFLTITASEAKQEKLYMQSFYGIKTTLTDSALKKGNKFEFLSSTAYPRGYYRIMFNDTNYADIILTPDEQVELRLNGNNLKEGLTVIRSRENSLLLQLKENKKATSQQVKRIIIESSYPDKSSKEYQALIRKKDSLNNASDAFVKELLKKNPDTYFTLTTKAFITSAVSDKEASIEYKNDEIGYMKKHFFDMIDFRNPDLIRTTLLPNRYMKYFETYVEYEEQGFKDAVDIILSKASANQQVFDLSLDFLMELFDKAGPEVIFEYITEKYYLTNSCAEQTDKNFVQKTSRYKSLMVGEIVPNIAVTDTTGKSISFDKIYLSNKVTLLFFWSSHCGFCQEELPVIKKLYSSYAKKGLAVYAVSIDENVNDWKASVKSNKLSWINVSEPGGWKAPAAEKFMVNRTPTVYLIDSNGKIIAKNLKSDKLESTVSGLFPNK